MANYNNFADFLMTLINGGDEHFTADNFSGSALREYAPMQGYFWDYVSDYMQQEGSTLHGWLEHWFIRKGDMDENRKSVMGYISQKANRGFKTTDFYNDNDKPEHWNESVQEMINSFNAMMGKDIDSHIGTTGFSVQDILKADAGFDYGKLYVKDSIEEQHNKDITWVKPWENIDGDSYKLVRGVDAIVSVLNSNHRSQYTRTPLNADDYNKELEDKRDIIEGLTGIPDVFPKDGGDGYINALDASQLMEYISKGFRGLTPTEYEELMQRLDIYLEGTPAPLQIVTAYTISYYAYTSTGGTLDFQSWLQLRRQGIDDKDMKANQYSTQVLRWLMERKEDYIRLIMPQYDRRVEIEDLNRNFWTIAQTLSALSCFLFANNNPIQDMFNKILDEEAQLWENILYLWVAVAIIGQEKTTEEIVQVILPIANSELQSDIKFDNFNDTVPPSEMAFATLVWNRCKHLINEYPKVNLVIIPEIRKENYKHNYYAEVMYPYVFTYNRNTGSLRTYSLDHDHYSVSLKAWDETHQIGGLKKKNNQYVYTGGWAGGTATVEGGFYYALLRPSIQILPYYDAVNNEIAFTQIGTSDMVIQMHDVATEIETGNEAICLTSRFDFTANTVSTTYSDTTGTDRAFAIAKGFYQGEILSYPKDTNANFTATINKVWEGDIPADKVASIHLAGYETRDDDFEYGGATQMTFTLPSQDSLGNNTQYTITETIPTGPNEEWITTYSPNNILTAQNDTVTITNKLYNIRFTDADFQIVKIGDFYPTTYMDGTRTIIPALSEVIRKTSDGNDPYDTDTYGIGAYVLRKANPAIAWPIEQQDMHVQFVDYLEYAQNGTISMTEGYSLTVSQLDTLSEQYIEYLKAHTNKLGDYNTDGIYATKFGTSFWVGDAGGQWSGGIIHALVFYNGTTHTAQVISHPQLFDGYWTNDTNVFSLHGLGYVNSAWRRLCLKCSKLSILYTNNVPDFHMDGGKLIWYDHWNDINGSYGRSNPRPNADMKLENSQLIFNSEYNPYGAETRMAVGVQYNGQHIFFNGDDDRIGIRRNDYTTGGPIRFTQNYDNINLNAAGPCINCYI